MNGDLITNTDFAYHDAERLVDYIGRGDHTVENRAGQEMTEEERERFVERSEHHGFERHIVFSPRDETYDLSEQDLKEATRDSVNSYFRDAETVDFCTAHHVDEKNGAHVHIALTGDKEELYMNGSHIQEFNHEGKEIVQEHDRSLENEILRENDLEQQHDQEQERDRGQDRGAVR